MPSVFSIHLAPLAIGLLWLSSWCAAAEDSLRVIDNPGGGRVVYGPVHIAAGNNARIQAGNAHTAEDARSASSQAHMDNIDRFTKSFQNYQIDQTGLQDNNLNARGAVPNTLADSLIRANPDRFQAIPAGNFLMGVDF